MLFNTPDFIIFFVFVLATVTIIKNRKFQHLFLLITSYFFFYYTSNYLVVLLIVSTLLDFYIAKEIWNSKSQSRKKLLLIISLAGNLGLLGFFKYADFAILQFNILGNTMNFGGDIPFINIALPIGISFYTFQTIGYTIDVYRGKLEPSKSLREFALFIAFFPQLVAGPIVRAKDFLPQLREKINEFETGTKLRQIVITNTHLKLGITIMAFGFLKKMFFADNIAPMANEVFSNPIGSDSFAIFLGTIAFGIQVYGDFSGYSDIAIGAALILGFTLPQNFNKPFFATSPADFWRRWHISLSNWVRDYLFLPIVHRNIGSDAQLIFGAMITFLLLGFWHGAGWNFIFFGLIHGIYVTIEVIIRKKIPKARNNKFFKRRSGKILAILGTQYLVFLAFIAFRVEDFDSMIYSMSKFIFFSTNFELIFSFLNGHKFQTFLIVLFIILNYISYTKKDLVKTISELRLFYWGLILFAIMLGIFLTFEGNPEAFIYFRF